ncbi:hypothetical protein [Streptomyces chryseus]
MSRCAICTRPAADEHHACATCVRQLQAWLREIPRQLPLLQASLRPETAAHTGRTGGAAYAHAPLPLRLDVLSLLGPGHPVPTADPYGDFQGAVPIASLLYGWAHYLAGDMPAVARDTHGTVHISPCEAAAPRHGTSVTAWCHWLTAYLPHAARRPWVRDLHHQLQDLTTHIRRITHAEPQRHPKTAPCPHCEAFALVEIDWQGICCEACGQHLEPEQYAAHAATVLAVLIRAHQPTPEPRP